MKNKNTKCDFFGPCDQQDEFSNKFSDELDSYKLKGNCCFFCGEDLSSFIDDEDVIIHNEKEPVTSDKYGFAVNKKDLMN